jgi:hypothetical protein
MARIIAAAKPEISFTVKASVDANLLNIFGSAAKHNKSAATEQRRAPRVAKPQSKVRLHRSKATKVAKKTIRLQIWHLGASQSLPESDSV